ncbi:fluoride efflux transporter CrcB [Amnibacterium flavum]|uniref:Fluoride-specific ion channel FluC n=1 Tax=Amnibacterium flavum TaxID=2173173 RepID=A0A2V1HR30_9MICO|nr:fluoride efflux transporter CrcB [Amnibacterium flavum]PVZ93430.1 fluoride efflux transporter CrcB [Amnibacterium flavum]
MTLLLLVATAAAGGVGAAFRLFLDGVIRGRTRPGFPLGTVVINISGSLAIGLVAGLVAGGVLPTEVSLVVATGFLGGYTTFSTASYETVRLVQARRLGAAALNAVGTVVVSTAAAAAGIAVGLLISG